jgi:DNA processing protein
MSPAQESAAIVALLRLGRRSQQAYADLIEEDGSAITVLERELAGQQPGQTSLLAPEVEPLLTAAAAEIDRWRADRILLVTLLDDTYPENLRAVHDRPPLLFTAGRLQEGDRRSVAVIGSRRASAACAEEAARIAVHLVAAGFAVVSGLAIGIDTAAHVAALDAGGRSLAVVGAGLEHSYPPQNSGLQRRLANECAVISQFWPEQPPSRQSFPMRNAVMSGMTLGTVIVEASATSGARIQARQALAHGRPVFVLRSVLEQPWARELTARPGAYVVDSAAQVTATIERLNAAGSLVG